MSRMSYAESDQVATRRRLALVLWSGGLGGAEILSATLAERLRRLGADVTIVFIMQPGDLAARLSSADVSYTSLRLARGRDVLRHPRRYAAEVARAGPDGALLVECGFMGAALRIGGYREPIVAVEHGTLNELSGFSRSKRLLWALARTSGAWADDAEVAVSDFILERMHEHSHARRIRRIYNGIDPDLYRQAADVSVDRSPDVVIGFAGRLVPGKGVNHLIRALEQASKQVPIRLRVAGDGPEREQLELLAHSSGVEQIVDFLGLTHDMPAFWQTTDIVTVPSELSEAFPMTTLEAMATGKPVIATRIGGIPELVVDGTTGILVPPGDVSALAEALRMYATSEALRVSHGSCGRDRVAEHFHIGGCAQAYIDMFVEMAAS